ncbi:hypothetical protein QN345_10115 [Cryobacterium sp. 10I1]|uniref:variant leucine-rich repeat-containing protein n=1 Tax=unclassified Cryobacterium TaxID=2649013 RepID=UPI002AB597F5|nr:MULTISPECIES: hypothetical protein [unclassified Cryobacterium]MDY7540844.1 hypothetical protein [Cryobacterium sp. 5B3]MEA9999809.1 hypothetical protein [Cryobacterium sp. RTS3]MEB0002476.1 hypothetical protein [Cryobacterium sp. RTC2.1]MEB0203755.1 hypothetical protein [Cryobacterium sp. 5I3]MEB0267443.1 hypothetical protein [Cryobacterium sp. 10I5]
MHRSRYPAGKLLPALPAALPQLMEPVPAPILELTPAELAADRATSAGDLADLAYLHPGPLPAIAANPSAYPELREWIAAAGDRPAPGGPTCSVG